MRADGRTQAKRGERPGYIFFGKRRREVFGQRFARLFESRSQKSFESGIGERPLFPDPKYGRIYFGGRNEGFGRHIETDVYLPAALRQNREGRKLLLSRVRSKLLRHLLLHHDGQASAVGVFEGPQNNIRGNVIGKVGDQMVGPAGQTLSLPVAQNIRAVQFEPSVFDERPESLAQMSAQVSVHLISGDILNLDQISGQIT